MTRPTPKRRTRLRSGVWQIAALALAALATLLLLVLPAYSSTSQSSDGPSVTTTTTLLEQQGPGVLGILAVPLVLMLVPLYVRGGARRWVSLACTALLFVGALLGLASIGMFYLPAVVCSIAATTAAMNEHRVSA
ncbi:MAG TPA: hypothetical protein VFL94_10125 [Actinomycetales bacterium]|nr:hypothetical protein [Actinomycetales bacterium]